MNETSKANSVKNVILNVKWWQGAILLGLLIGLTLAGGWAAREGAQVNIDIELQLQAQVDYLTVQQQLLNDTINIPVNSTVSAMVKEANYIVAPHGSYYCLINGTDDRGGRLEYFGTNKTLTQQYALGNMTNGLLYVKDCTFNTALTLTATQMVQESYQGLFNVYGSKGIIIAGWMNSTSSSITNLYLTNLYMTNGTSFGGAAGPAGSTYGLPYTYEIFNNATGTYKVDGVTSAILYYSTTNCSRVFDYTFGNMTTGAVFVRNGIYDMSGLASSSSAYFNLAGKDITLIGESWDDTIILDSRTGTTFTFNTVASSSPTANFTVRNIKFDRRVPSDATAKGCIGGSFYKIEVEHCQFLGNKVLAEGASHYLTTAVCGDWASDYFVNCYFKDNRVVDFQYGITSPHSTYTDVNGNYFENCWTQTVGIQLPLENGNYIIQNNFLNNCAEFDEGIAIDSTDPAVAVNVNGLISNNIIYNDATHDPVKPIAIITTSGVRVSNNRIMTLSSTDADWWGQISVDSRTSTEITNVTVDNNEIWTMQREGIQARGLSSGSVSGNVIHVLQATESYGILFSYSKAITYAGSTVNVEGNKIFAKNDASSRHAIHLTATAGTGAITFFIDNNYLEANVGVETQYSSLLSTVLGNGNIFNCTTYVLNSGASTAKYVANGGTVSNAADGVTVTHLLWKTPTIVIVTSQNSTATIICNAYSLGATTFILRLRNTADAAQSGQTLSWYAT